MKRVKKVYDFYYDPGHGWLKVELKELKRLGILNKISSCSYIRGKFAYIEEDGDLKTFIEAKCDIDHLLSIKYKEHYTDNYSRIRHYYNYSEELAVFNLEWLNVAIGDIAECNRDIDWFGFKMAVGDSFVIHWISKDKKYIGFEDSCLQLPTMAFKRIAK